MIPLGKAFLAAPLAHRTLHDVNDGRPENSIEGAQAAIDAGYGIEIDLQLSLDGVAYVFHDYDLKRLTGLSGFIQQTTSAEMDKIRPLGGKHPVPRFDAFLDMIAGRVPLLVELKPQDVHFGPEDAVMALAVKEAIKTYQGPLAFMSFSPLMMAHFKTHLPDHARGLVTDPYTEQDWPMLTAEQRQSLAKIPDYDALGASFISHNVGDLDSPEVAKVQSKGGAILCWTVKSEAEEKRARRIAQNITFEQYLA